MGWISEGGNNMAKNEEEGTSADQAEKRPRSWSSCGCGPWTREAPSNKGGSECRRPRSGRPSVAEGPLKVGAGEVHRAISCHFALHNAENDQKGERNWDEARFWKAHMEGSWNGGTPQWMVFKGKIPSINGWSRGTPHFRKPPYFVQNLGSQADPGAHPRVTRKSGGLCLYAARNVTKNEAEKNISEILETDTVSLDNL